MHTFEASPTAPVRIGTKQMKFNFGRDTFCSWFLASVRLKRDADSNPGMLVFVIWLEIDGYDSNHCGRTLFNSDV